MKFMLDTNICIHIIRQKPRQVLGRLQRTVQEGICVSSITLGELEVGVAKSSAPQQNQEGLIRFLSIVDVLPFDDRAAVEYGEVQAALEQAGTPIAPLDTLIAAHARSQGLTLVTNNTREYRHVPGLALENWV